MRGDGLRGVRGSRGSGRYRRVGVSSYRTYHHHGYNIDRREHHESGDEGSVKDMHERHEYKSRVKGIF